MLSIDSKTRKISTSVTFPIRIIVNIWVWSLGIDVFFRTRTNQRQVSCLLTEGRCLFLPNSRCTKLTHNRHTVCWGRILKQIQINTSFHWIWNGRRFTTEKYFLTQAQVFEFQDIIVKLKRSTLMSKVWICSIYLWWGSEKKQIKRQSSCHCDVTETNIHARITLFVKRFLYF